MCSSDLWPVCSKKAGLTKGSGAEHQDVTGEKTTAKETKTEEAQTKQVEVDEAVSVEGTYTVRPGDTLSTIAAEFGVEWQRIFDANRGEISDANLIFPGQQLAVK